VLLTCIDREFEGVLLWYSHSCAPRFGIELKKLTAHLVWGKITVRARGGSKPPRFVLLGRLGGHRSDFQHLAMHCGPFMLTVLAGGFNHGDFNGPAGLTEGTKGSAL
jgi:hypothetical protein